jgi:small redox-active disulfide protein 2
MKDIKVLGPGCKRCEQTAEMVKAEASRLGVAVSVSKVTDYAEIAAFGIAATPGVVVDGRVVHAGGLPRAEDIAGWLAPAEAG